MATEPILNPPIPYVGQVEVVPGKMVKVQGKTPPDAVRFAINYQLGPTLNPRDDIAIHVSPRFPEGFITRNHIVSMTWGMEENEGPMWIQPGQEFEILLLCDHDCFKIAINGKHFTEFMHRLPYQKITHLVIDGDVEVECISYEIVPVDPPRSPRSAPIPDVPSANYGPPPPGGLYPTLDPQGYGPPPPAGYGPPPDPYNPPRAYGQEKPEESELFGGCLDKMGLSIGGLVAAGGVAAAAYALNKKKNSEEEKEHEKIDASKSKTESESGLGNLGSLGAALASSLVSNALHSNTHAVQGYPSQESGGSGGGGVLGSILGALGGAGGAPQPAAPPPANNDPLKGALGSIIGGVLGGGGNQHQQPPYQPSGGYGGYQPPGAYPGYGQQQGSGGSDLLSGIGSAIGSSLLSSALGGLSKSGKDKSNSSNPAPPPPYNAPAPPPNQPAPRPNSPPTVGGRKLTMDEISKGLGLDD